MAVYVKNPAGTVHSVAEDFEAPADWGKEGEDWHVVTEDEAREAHPALFGAPDPRVLATRLSDERAADPDDHGVPGPSEPQPTNPDGTPIPTPDATPEVGA
jgi:hypothetical protein